MLRWQGYINEMPNKYYDLRYIPKKDLCLALVNGVI